MPSLPQSIQTTGVIKRGTKRRLVSQFLPSLIGPEGREPRKLTLVGLLVGGALIAFFAVLEDVVTGDPLVRVDDGVFHFLQSVRTASLDHVMVVITELGDWVVTTAVAMVAFLWLFWFRNRRTALYLSAAVLGSSVFSFLLKLSLRVAPADRSQFWMGYLLVSQWPRNSERRALWVSDRLDCS